MSELTIRDIANMSGVSVSTVSRVINGNGKVIEQNKKKVQEVLAQTGFVPNISARTLKSKKSYTIGLIVTDISDRYYSLMTKTLAEALTEKDYSLIVCCTDNKPSKEKMFFDFLSAKNVDGLIINTAGGIDNEITNLANRIPVVLVNRKITTTRDDVKFDYVGMDDINGAYELTKYLLSIGHKKIGIINGQMNVSSGWERNNGFEKAMAEAGLPIHQDYKFRYNGEYNIKTGWEGARYLLTQDDKPTAIIAMNDSITIGVMKYCQRNKIDIPEDVSLIAYGDVDNSELFSICPNCLALNPETIGKESVRCVLSRIENPGVDKREIIFSGILEAGNSTVSL